MHLDKNDWKLFIENGVKPQQRDDVGNSWELAAAYGVDVNTPIIPGTHNSSRAESPKQGTLMHDIINYINPVLKGNRGKPLSWVVCDGDGYIIKTLTENTDFKEHLKEGLGVKPGLCLDTKQAGTQAIGLAIEHNAMQKCIGAEHYCATLHPYTTLASPVFSIDGERIAIVGLIGVKDQTDLVHMASMMRLLIQGIDTKARLERCCKRNDMLMSRMESFFVDDTKPSILVNTNGFIRHINPTAAKLLEVDLAQGDKQLDNVAKFTPPIKELANNGIIQKDLPLTVSLDNKRIRFKCDKRPMYSRDDKFLGVGLTLHEMDREDKDSKKINSEAKYTFSDIIGNAPSINHAIYMARQVAKSNISVLLTGESGTGKEMFAHAVHNESENASGPFVSINCAAIPRDIAESELFGYVKGAFTGALKEGREGKLEAANGGTLFLDEIGEMPPDLQAKLLRVLENQTVTRIGEIIERPVNFRCIAATNKDLRQLIEDGLFRDDLYYRFAVSTINLPPLRESKDDIPELFINFVEYYNENLGKRVQAPCAKILDRLRNYQWPGNIRELRNAAEYAVMMNNGDEAITMEHLPGEMRMSMLYVGPVDVEVQDPLFHDRVNIEMGEQQMIEKALRMTNHHVEDASRLLGMSRATLYRRLKKFNIQRNALLSN